MADYAEQSGIVTIFPENLNLVSSWEVATTKAGYTNTGYIRWTDADNFSTPGTGTITATIEITNTGVYQFQWYNTIGQGSSISDYNDSWVRFNDADEFFGGWPNHTTDIIYPNGSGQTPTADGAGSGNWFKAYANDLNWNWDTFTSDNDAHNIYVQFDNPGTYTMEISARSFNHLIDRIVLHHVTLASDPLNLSNSETLDGGSSPVITGEQKVWHPIKFTYTSSSSYSETGSPNPFTDRRLYMDFTGPSAQTYRVPGYFAADGNAAESSSTSGNKWVVKFTPDEAGSWSYTTSFRSGTNIAAEYPINVSSGSTLDFNGDSDTFTVTATDKSAPDFRALGRVSYDGTRYPSFPDGTPFLKCGPDSPETFLAYDGFDNTHDGTINTANTVVKSYSAHSVDVLGTEPTWQGTKGANIMGLLNYLNSKGANSVSFLTNNIIGDGRNVWPWAATSHGALDGSSTPDTNNRTQYDVSKLDQWDRVFTYAQQLGIFLHFKLEETENNTLLDNWDLGTQRKVYYREMIARFGHHLALNWNMSEEYDEYRTTGSGGRNDATLTKMKEYLEYMKDTDPYGHLRVLHSYPPEQDDAYDPLLGSASELTGISLQVGTDSIPNGVRRDVSRWIADSAAAGKQWVVANDEIGPFQEGVTEDAAYGPNTTHPDNRNDVRKYVLWGTFLAGGWGVEYYYGYQTNETDLNAEDQRSRETKWEDGKRALDFFNQVNLKNFTPDDTIVTNSNWCLKNDGNQYIIYLPNGGTCDITTTGTLDYDVQWYDPRNGGSFQTGSLSSIPAGTFGIGQAPNSTSSDWAVLLTQQAAPETGDTYYFSQSPLGANTSRGAYLGSNLVSIGKKVNS